MATNPTDVSASWQPEQWFEFLMKRFDEKFTEKRHASTANTPKTRRERLDLFWSYYIGDPPLPNVQEKYQDTFREVLRKARNNYAAMSVDVMTDKSVLTGVLTDAESDVDGDDIARQIGEESGWEAMQRDLQTYMYLFGESYALVIPPLEGVPDAMPMITAENPRFALGIPDPLNPRHLKAFVKITNDVINDQQVGHLFVNSVQYEFRRDVGMYTNNFTIDEWQVVNQTSLANIEIFGGVPAVRFDNKFGLGEFEPNIDLLDRIMDGVLQRIVIQWYQSFRQRAVKGDLDGGADFSDPEEDLGNFIRRVADTDIQDLFTADPGALWLVPEGVDFWESQQAELTPLLTAIRDDVKEFAASTRTPLHVITPDAANGSAEGASLMRETLEDKVSDRQSRMTAPWILTWKLAFTLAGQANRIKGVKLLWRPIAKDGIAQQAEAVAKTKGVVSRKRQVIKFMAFTPEEAKLNEAELMQEMLAAQAFAIPAGGATTGQAGQPQQQGQGQQQASAPAGQQSASQSSGSAQPGKAA
ncbi:phage portal protein [Nocardia sp. NPDC056611]|uniref:phage portal protein n=1 Tax=Nocardia sp. NPDC056611 TaxID=3345877 RepID=UPI00366F6DC7